MYIDAKTKLYAIFGCPLKHTLSPKLHSKLFNYYKINAVYLAFESDNIRESIDAMRYLDIKGANVTIPHKENVIPFLDSIDADTEIIGAVNTIKNINGNLIGYNTDYLGFMYMVTKNIKNYSTKNFTMLGAGGAARAIVYALYKLGINHLLILNRTKSKSEKLKNEFSKFIKIDIAPLNDCSAIKRSDVIINSTSVGLHDNNMPIDINCVDKIEVLDIIYSDSALIRQSKKRGYVAVNGMDMFIGQAYYSFKIWSGIEFDRGLAYKIAKGIHIK
jgi:shikimate dehydrogenase